MPVSPRRAWSARPTRTGGEIVVAFIVGDADAAARLDAHLLGALRASSGQTLQFSRHAAQEQLRQVLKPGSYGPVWADSHEQTR